MKVLVGFLVLGLVLFVGIGTAGAQSSNPQHSIDLSQAKTTTNNVVNAGAVQPSTGTVPGLDEHGPHDYTASGLDTRQRRKAEELSTASPAAKK